MSDEIWNMYVSLTDITHKDNVSAERHDDKKHNYVIKSRQKRLTSYKMNQTEIMKVNVKKLERRYLEVSIIIDKAQHEKLGEFSTEI